MKDLQFRKYNWKNNSHFEISWSLFFAGLLKEIPKLSGIWLKHRYIEFSSCVHEILGLIFVVSVKKITVFTQYVVKHRGETICSESCHKVDLKRRELDVVMKSRLAGQGCYAADVLWLLSPSQVCRLVRQI